MGPDLTMLHLAWSKERVVPLPWGRTSLLWGKQSTGTGCPERLWILLLWRYFIPTPTILWFCLNELFTFCSQVSIWSVYNLDLFPQTKWTVQREHTSSVTQLHLALWVGEVKGIIYDNGHFTTSHVVGYIGWNTQWMGKLGTFLFDGHIIFLFLKRKGQFQFSRRSSGPWEFWAPLSWGDMTMLTTVLYRGHRKTVSMVMQRCVLWEVSS